MAEAFETAVHVDRQSPFAFKESGVDVFFGLTPGAEAKVFVDHHFRDREAVMDFRDIDLIAGIFDPGHFVGLGRGSLQGVKTGPAETGATVRQHRVHRDTKAFNVYRVWPHGFGPVGAGDDRTGGAVAVAAAIKQAQRRRNDGRLQHFFQGHLFVEVGFGCQHAVAVVLDSNFGDGFLALFRCQAVLFEIAGANEGKGPGRRPARFIHRVHSPTDSQSGRSGVLEFFHAQGHDRVVSAAGDCHNRRNQGDMAGAAPVLIANDRDIFELQRVNDLGSGQTAHRRIHLPDKYRLDVLRADAGVFIGFIGRFNGQITGSAVPAFPEPGTAHTDDGYVIFDCHCPNPPLRTGRHFQ